MNRSVLLVSTASTWLGTARMPRTLANAGFEVSLLAPPDSLAAKSRFCSLVEYLAGNATAMEWLLAFVAIVNKVRPRLVVPCDEMAIRLFTILVLDPPPGFSPALRSTLSALIQESLGAPAFYETSIDKTALPSAAQALGVRVPPYVVAAGIGEAEAFAARQGYPVVLKRPFGFAGQGVVVAQNRDELARGVTALRPPDQLDLGHRGPDRILVQAFVNGAHHSQTLVTWRGATLAGFARERYVATARWKGQTAVVRFVHSPETRAFSELLCRAFGMSGFCSIQFMIHADTGDAYLLEINRRIVTHMHMGERVGVDLGTALYDHLAGVPRRTAAVAANESERIVAVFPREWLRDPGSRYLSDYPVDIPWDDPNVFAAMLAMRHES